MLANKRSPTTPEGARKRTRGRPRLEDVADIERELLDVALGEFLQHGYGGASMAMIVKTAGVSKTTLYSRFSSKKELFLAIVRRMLDSQDITEMMDLGETPPTLEAGLKQYAKAAIEISMSDLVRGMDRLIYAESHRFPELGAAGMQQMEVATDAIAAFIERCAEREGIPCSDPRTPADVFAKMMRGYHVESHHIDAEVPKEEREAWIEKAVDILLKSREDW